MASRSSSSRPSSGARKGSGDASAARTGSADGRERREAQREALRRQRQAELRRQKRLRTVVISVIAVVALAVVAGIGYAIYQANRPSGPVVAPTDVAKDQPYYEFGAPADSGKPVVDVYLDFMCPFCGQFHEVNGKDLDAMVKDKTVTVHLHTRNSLDAASTTGDYSSRAANAFAAVYSENPELAWAYQDLLFQNQPQERTAGLTNAQLVDLAVKAGATKDKIQPAVSAKTYVPWIQEVVEKDAAAKTEGTPAILVNGKDMGSSWQQPGVLAQLVAQAGGGSASDAGGTSDGGS